MQVILKKPDVDRNICHTGGRRDPPQECLFTEMYMNAPLYRVVFLQMYLACLYPDISCEPRMSLSTGPAPGRGRRRPASESPLEFF